MVNHEPRFENRGPIRCNDSRCNESRFFAVFRAEAPNHLWVEITLRDLDPLVQAFRGVVRHNRDFALRDDLPVIDLIVDMMDRAAGYLLAGGQRLLPRFQTSELWQKRWMNVDDPSWKRLQHWRFQDAHKPC